MIPVRSSFLALLLIVALPVSAGLLRDEFMEGPAIPEIGAMESGSATLPAGTRVLHDVAYGNDARQAMDVYIPGDAKTAPVIIMVHGGAWFRGDKNSRGVVENKAGRWLPKGFIFISVNYRMLPTLDALGQAQDVARALAFAQAQAASWGGDGTKIILMGHSAGAHLVSLLAADPEQAYALGAIHWLGTISLDSAALDVVKVMGSRHMRFYDRAFGSNPANWRLASPIHVLSNKATPLLAVCSTQRKDHSCSQARDYVQKSGILDINGGIIELDISHGDINKRLGLKGPYTEAVEKFMGSLDAGVKAALTGQ